MRGEAERGGRVTTASSCWPFRSTLSVTDSFVASSHGGSHAGSAYTLSGGALHVGHELLIGQNGPADFTLKGSKGVVTADRMNLGAGAGLSFVLDSDGAGLIKLRNTMVRNDQSRLVIDGTQYRGGPKTFPLVVCGADLTAKSRFTPEQVSFTGFDGVVPRLAFRSGGMDLVLEAVQ